MDALKKYFGVRSPGGGFYAPDEEESAEEKRGDWEEAEEKFKRTPTDDEKEQLFMNMLELLSSNQKRNEFEKRFFW